MAAKPRTTRNSCSVMGLTQQDLKHQNSAIHPDLETATATEVLPAVPI